MFKEIKKQLDETFAAREKALVIQRQTIPLCSNAIRMVHKNKLDEAIKISKQIKQNITKMEQIIKDHPDLKSGIISSIYQEYAELEIYYSYVTKKKLPILDVPSADYLSGLGDAIGEMKRRCLELLAKHQLKEAEKLEEALEDIYYEFSSLNYPNSIVPSLKRKQDVARKVLNELHNQILSYKLQR